MTRTITAAGWSGLVLLIALLGAPDRVRAQPASPAEKSPAAAAPKGEPAAGEAARETRGEEFKPLDGVAARVNGEVITWTDVRQKMGNVAGVLGHASEAEFEAKLWAYALKNLRELIHDKLLLQMAKQEGITVSDEEVAREFRFRKQRAGSSAAFWKLLQDRGQTISDVEREIREDLLRMKYTQAKVNYVPWAPHVQRFSYNVSPRDVRNYYLAHPDQFSQRATVWLRCAHLDGSVFGGRQKALELAEAVTAELRKGTAPAAVDRMFKLHCRELSCAVDDLTPIYEESGFLNKVKTWAFAQPAGAVSEPLEITPGNWKVFVVARKQEAMVRKFEQVQEQIEESLRRQGLQHARMIMQQELYREADIEPLDLKQWILDRRKVFGPNRPVVLSILSKPL